MRMAGKEPSGGAASALEAVLQQSDKLPSDTPQIRGYDFNEGLDYDKLLSSMLQTGVCKNCGLWPNNPV